MRRSLICCLSRGIFSASIHPAMWGKEGFSGTSELGIIIQISPHGLDVVPVTLWVMGIIHVNIYAASCSRCLLYCCVVSLAALLLWMATWGHPSSLFQLVGPTHSSKWNVITGGLIGWGLTGRFAGRSSRDMRRSLRDLRASSICPRSSRTFFYSLSF